MTRKLIAAAAVAFITALSAPGAAAQAQFCTGGNSCGLNNSASVTVGTVLRLDLSTSATALTAPDNAAYIAGFLNDNGPTATVKSNTAWTLNISSAASTWTGTAGANPGKLSADLKWALASGGPYVGLSTSPAAVVTSGGTSGVSQSFFYKTLWSYASDTPGNYSLVVVYSLTAP